MCLPGMRDARCNETDPQFRTPKFSLTNISNYIVVDTPLFLSHFSSRTPCLTEKKYCGAGHAVDHFVDAIDRYLLLRSWIPGRVLLSTPACSGSL